MAAIALIAELTIVWIVVRVTASTVLRQVKVADAGYRMTFRAGDLRMRTRQRKSSTPLMIEIPQRPGASAVAVRAVRAESRLVRVILGVAGRAFAGRAAIVFVLMAGVALGRAMRTHQGEARLVVIEPDRGPAILGMTLATRAAQLALVRIVLAVALDAIANRVAMHDSGGMAGIALRLAMLAEQLERRISIVLEAALLPIGCSVAVGA